MHALTDVEVCPIMCYVHVEEEGPLECFVDIPESQPGLLTCDVLGNVVHATLCPGCWFLKTNLSILVMQRKISLAQELAVDDKNVSASEHIPTVTTH